MWILLYRERVMGRVRLTWSLTPHSPAEEVTDPVVAALTVECPARPCGFASLLLR